MSANSFSFPPPPPPPPQETPVPSTNSYPRGRGDKRWDRGSRGRGRGHNQRGYRGGGSQGGGHAGNYGANNGSQFGAGSYPLPTYPHVQQPQYSFNNATPQYSPVVNYHAPQQAYPYYPAAYQVAQPQAPPFQYAVTPQIPQTHGYSHQIQNGRPHQVSNRYDSPPVAMGPPIRLGFGNEQGTATPPLPPPHDGLHGNTTKSQRGESRPSFQQDSFFGHQRGRGRGRGRSPNWYQGDRGHHSTGSRHDSGSNFNDSGRPTQVAPAVPAFGNPLPVKPPSPQPPASQAEVKKPWPKKKKKRRVNQLGLTPKAEEHVSSSEEEDEEAKLAAKVGAAGTNGHQLQFTYKGQTSTLHSSTDIASWIEERKKRFPTAARKAEKEAARQKIKEEREERQRAQLAEKRAEKLRERQQRTLDKDKQASAEKAKVKVEKLRKRLEKEERRIAKAEAKSLKRSASPEDDGNHARELKRKRGEPQPCGIKAETSATPSIKVEPIVLNGNGEAAKCNQISDEARASAGNVKAETLENPIPGPLTPTSQPALPEQEIEQEVKLDPNGSDVVKPPYHVLEQSATDGQYAPATEDIAGKRNAESEALSDLSVSSDDDLDDTDDESTSSSGSDSSSASDSDIGGPETASTRREGPQRVPPPKRNNKQQSKAICRDFLQSGRCRRGKKCKWRHALPQRGEKRAEEEAKPSKSQRKSLHQRVRV
ncbi:MAG: hypothetical protein Q9218_003378 [Villophora microphyllina]